MKAAERYPKALAALERLGALRPASSGSVAPAEAFVVGPAVLRAPPGIARAAEAEPPAFEDVQPPPASTDEMLGELVDMVFVGADEPESGGHHEVHLVFKAEVLGGLHMRLRKMPDGMHATFVVEDAASRRAVAEHVDGLVAHLKGRGFSIASHAIEIAR